MDYEPRSVRELLTEMMSRSSIQFDLAIASLATNDDFLARRVVEMEASIDNLTNQLLMHTALGIRSPKDAEELLPLFHVSRAVGAMSDVAGNISEIVLAGNNPFKERNTIFLFMHEFLDAVPVNETSCIVGSQEKDLDLQETLGIDIVAIRRDDQLLLGHAVDFKNDDIIYIRGPLPNVIVFSELVRGHLSSLEEAKKLLSSLQLEEPQDDLRSYEAKLLRLIDFASLMLDLSFLVHLDPAREYRSAITAFEDLVDRTLREYYKDLLEAYAEKIISESESVGLLKLGTELEMMADYAFQLAFGPHKKKGSGELLLQDIMEGTSEGVEVIPISINSPYVNKSIREAELETEISGEVFNVIALRRKGKIVPFPDEDIRLKPGDILIIKVYHDEEISEEVQNSQVANH